MHRRFWIRYLRALFICMVLATFAPGPVEGETVEAFRKSVVLSAGTEYPDRFIVELIPSRLDRELRARYSDAALLETRAQSVVLEEEPHIVMSPDQELQIVALSADEEQLRLEVLVAAADLLERHGGVLRHVFSSDDFVGFSFRGTLEEAESILREPLVLAVEQAETIRPYCNKEPCSRPSPPSPWGLDRVDQREGTSLTVFNQRLGGGPPIVFVLDTGIYAKKSGSWYDFHDEFNGRIQAVVTLGADSIDDCDGHGTHVAGTIAGENVGIAPDVWLIPVKVLRNCDGTGSSDDIIRLIDYISRIGQRPAVANYSVSGGSRIEAAAHRLIATGVVFVAAAGNDGQNACDYPVARSPRVVSVGATNLNDRITSFSRRGPCIDVFAPGVRIRSAGTASSSSLVELSGTSMAAPHAAGVAALLLDPETVYEGPPSPLPAGSTPADVLDAIRDLAAKDVLLGVPAGTPNRLLQSVWGVPASQCKSEDLRPDASVGVNLTYFDCEAGPLGSGYPARILRVSGNAGKQLSIFARWEYYGRLILEDPGGSVVATSFGLPGSERTIRHLAQSTGTYRAWVTGGRAKSTGFVYLEDRSDTSGLSADLYLEGMAEPTAIPAYTGHTTFTFRLLHESGDAIAGAVLETGHFPADSQLVSHTIDSGSCSLDLSKVSLRCVSGPLQEGGEVRLDVELRSQRPTHSLLLGARARSDVFDPDLADNSASARVLVTDFHVQDQTEDAVDAFAPSQVHGIGQEDLTSWAADDIDLSLPKGSSWKIEKIGVQGSYLSGTGPVTGVDAFFYPDEDGIPGSIATCSYENVVPTVGNASLAFSLPSSCDLPGGRYWLGVAARIPPQAGSWGWQQSGFEAGQGPSVWRNPGGGQGKGCESWGLLPGCLATGEPDLAFRIEGQVFPPIPMEIQASSRSWGDQSEPRIALGAGGGVVVWRDDSIPNDPDVYARPLGPTGLPSGPDFLVNTVTSGPQAGVDAAAYPGGFFAAWFSYGQDGDMGGIFGRRYSTDGQPVGPELPINDVTDGQQSDPDTDAAPSGTVTVVWTSTAPSRPGIVARQLFDDGSFSPEIEVSPSGTQPSVAVCDSGRAWISWAGAGVSSTEIWARTVDGTGAVLGPIVRVNLETAGSQVLPSIDVDSECQPVVVWQSPEQSGTWGVRARRLRSDGLPAGPEIVVETERWPQAGFGPAVSVNSSSGFVVSWVREGENRAFARWFAADGSAVGPPVPLSVLAKSHSRNISVAMNSNDLPIFVWDSGQIDGFGGGVALLPEGSVSP